MDPWEVLKRQVEVVAALGELVATVPTPCRCVWPLLCPESLHTALRRLTWHLRDTLEHGDAISQALAALGATPGTTWDDVTAAASAWRKSRLLLLESSIWLTHEAKDLPNTWEDEETAIAQAGDLWDETAGWGTAGDNLVAATWQTKVTLAKEVHEAQLVVAVKATSPREVAARREEQMEDVCISLCRLVVACYRASQVLWKLQHRLGYIELALKKKGCVAAVVKAEWLWEGSARLATHQLLVTLGNIHNLLLSPCCGSDGSVSPGGFCRSSVISLFQKDMEKFLSMYEKLRAAPSFGETNNGSPITGAPEEPERTWGKPEPGAIFEMASHLSSHLDLLPPGTRCELATSTLTSSFKNSCHECIPIGVTGASQQRQDFLIIGKDSNETLGLSVLPAVVSVNCNEELSILALAYKASVVIEPKTPIAVAIALPMNINKRAGCREKPFESFNPHVRWVKHITNEQPELTCSLTYLEKTVHITGTLDTGSDITTISYTFWPSDWNLETSKCVLTGIGGATRCMQSESMITVTGPEGKTATTRPLVMKKPITLWGRDVMSQWRAKMEVDS